MISQVLKYLYAFLVSIVIIIVIKNVLLLLCVEVLEWMLS